MGNEIAAYLPPLVAGVLGLVVGVLVTARLADRSLGSAWRLRAERPRDVVVPLLTAAACVAMTIRFGLAPVLPAYLYLAVVSMPLAAIDVEQHRLPDVLTLPSYPISLGLLGIAVPFTPDGGRHMLGAVIGLVGLGVLYGVLFLVNPNGIGLGDVKLAGVLGAYLGWLGFDSLIVGAFLGVVLGGVFALILLLMRRATKKTQIPFGPFMLAGTLIAVLLSQYQLLL